MAEMMWRLAKHEGVGNVVLDRVPLPQVGVHDVLVRTHVSLISRGSELWRRYIRTETVDPSIMGYSTTGVVVQTGSDVAHPALGDRVVVSAPHAEYSLVSVHRTAAPRLFPLHPALSFEEGTFHPLATSSAGWTRAAQVGHHDRVVILGQGIVGNLVMQFTRRFQPALLVAVDALDLRCRLAEKVGAPVVVNAASEDPVAAVRRVTDNQGGSIVVDCVGGRAGVSSFAQAQEMLAPGGLLHLIGLYHEQPLPLDASRMMGKRLLGGYPPDTSRVEMGAVAMEAMAAGEVRVQALITHQFPGHQAKEAFDLLYEHPEQAMGVLLVWN